MPPEPRSPDAEDFHLHAWVDESMRAARKGTDGIYLMAAAVADPSMCDEVRDDLRAMTENRAERLHWRHETPERQAKIAAAESRTSGSRLGTPPSTCATCAW
jgi:hypothetical protein